jgi:transcriptional regulator with GAF, ATPase, and Fis domain
MKTLLARALAGMGKVKDARAAITEAIGAYHGRSPFDVRLTASLAQAQIEQGNGAPLAAVDENLESIIQVARKKKMRWHLAGALMIRGTGLLASNRRDEAEGGLREAVEIARSISDRTLEWQANALLGRLYEQRLQYERAFACYRVAALTIKELALNIVEERYKRSFLDQPKLKEVLEHYERLRLEVGKRARYDLAAMSRSEKISRKMLGALSAIGQKLTSILDLNELLRTLLDLSIENVRAERGIVFLRDEITGEMRVECAQGMGEESLEEVASFSRSVVKRVADGETLLTVDVGKDATLSAYESLSLYEIKSILCVPMKARGKVIGVIYLDTRRAAQLFTDKERAFIDSFAGQAAIAVENARLFGSMNTENMRLRSEVEGRSRFENLVGASPAMRKLVATISSVLESECNVLILGESGTGKDLVAKAIHYNGPRRKKQFLAVDCGALPENLLEAELFGHARGAFTGADRDRIGLIQEADGGTLFLDEIANTSLALQARLLRVLQEHEVRRLGENTTRRVDVRILAATNADLHGLIAQGRFRQDLYYRLNVVTIEVPPLRDRREDIPLLVDHLLRERGKQGLPVKPLGPGILAALSRHDWPGNVRELENVVERLSILSPGNVVTEGDLPDWIRLGAQAGASRADGGGNGHKTGEQLMIEDALRRFSGDKAKAARFIGWNRQKLYRRMKAFAIVADYGRAV